MLKFAVCEISGKQYLISPKKLVLVDYLGESKEVEHKVLLLVEDGKIKLGNPYLKEKVNLQLQESFTKSKIRVFKFHAKSNYRRTAGQKIKASKVILVS